MLVQSPPLLGFVPTMQPTLADTAPSGSHWIHELKYNGFRTELLLNGSYSRAFTRNGQDWTERYRLIVDAAQSLTGGLALLDGEIVVQGGGSGQRDLHAVRSAITSAPDLLVFYAFDLLMIEGNDIRHEPLLNRRERLRYSIGKHDPSFPLRFSDHVVGNGPDFFHKAEQLGLEGIVSKRADSSYRSGYTEAWLKTKAFTEEQLVIVGSEQRIGPTKVLCARETHHGLEYAGTATLALPAQDRERFWRTIGRLRRTAPPLPMDKGKLVDWLHPELRARVRHLRGEESLRQAKVLSLL